ncbi:hypothetical protein BpHYR1_039113 [Brachionus plicatilis]|uniref:Uncharacterized protein n=1 Tax=Brachionus plicatilis TaxID=10195 RepID=A0A3M7T228_BRAPC|nr:hypothetical protein BpHYR1_039113 [Brachionus plicatilis]
MLFADYSINSNNSKGKLLKNKYKSKELKIRTYKTSIFNDMTYFWKESDTADTKCSLLTTNLFRFEISKGNQCRCLLQNDRPLKNASSHSVLNRADHRYLNVVYSLLACYKLTSTYLLNFDQYLRNSVLTDGRDTFSTQELLNVHAN